MKAETESPAEAIQALLCFAVKEEIKALLPLRVLMWHNKVLITGIGRKNAEQSLRKSLTSLSPERVFTCGFAGGLNPDLTLGAILFDTTEEDLRAKLLAAGAQPAKFFCADRIAVTVAEKQKLRAETGADAVEMESAAIHAVCREHSIPCTTVRVISDTAGENLPMDFNALAKPDQTLDYARLVWTVLRSPGKINTLRRFQKQTQFAARKLADVLGKVIGPP